MTVRASLLNLVVHLSGVARRHAVCGGMFAVWLWTWNVCLATDAAPMSLDSFPQTTLAIVTPDARQHRFSVWIADNDARREQGLMFVRELPAHAGMLFLFPAPQPVAMWMKNTFIPLDMLFIDHEGRVDSIIANAQPQSLKILQSRAVVSAVLELPGGTAKQLNIAAGARVHYPAP